MGAAVMRDGSFNLGDPPLPPPASVRAAARPPAGDVPLPLSALPDPALLLDGDGRWLAANAAAETLLGCDPGDLAGAPAAAALRPWPAAPPGCWGAAEARRADGQLVPIDVWVAPAGAAGPTLVVLRRADGRGARPVAGAVPADGEGRAVAGRPPGDVPVATESPSDRAGTRLHTDDARFRAAFADAPIGMALATPDGRLVQVNRALCDILGYAAAELVGRPLARVTHPDDEGADAGHLARLLAGERASYQVEKRYLRKDGRVAWGRLSASLVRDEAGEPAYLVAQIQDITPYKAFGAALRASEARFRAAFADAPIGVALLDPDGRFALANRALCAFLGRAEEDLVGASAASVVHPDDVAAAAAALRRLFAGAAAVARSEHRYVCADGSVVWGDLSASLVRDDGDRPLHVVVHVQDVTERKRAEAELLAAKQAAEQASRLKSGFLSTMSHELRTPLTAIMGYAGLLRLGPLDPEAAADVDQIARSADQLLELIDDLLDLSRIEAGKLELATDDVDVAAVLAEVAAAVRPRVRGDAVRIRQLLLNLVDNAVKFTERGSVTVTARAAGGESVRIAVADTGIGIAPEALPHVFDEFRQADGSPTRRFGGSGLGLAIVDRLVRMHGGAVGVESTPGAGSTFTVHLPVRPAG
jgi:PAS domain S-box-containing protein